MQHAQWRTSRGHMVLRAYNATNHALSTTDIGRFLLAIVELRCVDVGQNPSSFSRVSPFPFFFFFLSFTLWLKTDHAIDVHYTDLLDGSHMFAACHDSRNLRRRSHAKSHWRFVTIRTGSSAPLQRGRSTESSWRTQISRSVFPFIFPLFWFSFPPPPLSTIE